MQERDVKGDLCILGIAVCLAVLLMGNLIKNPYPRLTAQILGVVVLMQLSVVDEGRARERRDMRRHR